MGAFSRILIRFRYSAFAGEASSSSRIDDVVAFFMLGRLILLHYFIFPGAGTRSHTSISTQVNMRIRFLHSFRHVVEPAFSPGAPAASHFPQRLPCPTIEMVPPAGENDAIRPQSPFLFYRLRKGAGRASFPGFRTACYRGLRANNPGLQSAHNTLNFMMKYDAVLPCFRMPFAALLLLSLGYQYRGDFSDLNTL